MDTQPAVSLRPSANGGPAEIRFGRQADGAFHPSDWFVGQAARNAGDVNFGIGSDGQGLVIKIDGTFGTTTFNYPVNVASTLTINSQPVATKPWIAGWFFCNPVSVVSNNEVQRTFSVSRTETGHYTVSWTGPHPKGNQYTAIAVMNNLFGQLIWQRSSSTSLSLLTFNSGDFAQDPVEITVMIL